MNFRQILLLSGSICLLGACDMVVNQMAEQTDDGDMRQNFVQACGVELSNASANTISTAQGQDICGCMYDKTLQSYSDVNAFKRAVIRYGLPSLSGEKDNDFLQRFEANAPACVQNVMGGNH